MTDSRRRELFPQPPLEAMRILFLRSTCSRLAQNRRVFSGSLRCWRRLKVSKRIIASRAPDKGRAASRTQPFARRYARSPRAGRTRRSPPRSSLSPIVGDEELFECPQSVGEISFKSYLRGLLTGVTGIATNRSLRIFLCFSVCVARMTPSNRTLIEQPAKLGASDSNATARHGRVAADGMARCGPGTTAGCCRGGRTPVAPRVTDADTDRLTAIDPAFCDAPLGRRAA